jgi:hypothetical protein
MLAPFPTLVLVNSWAALALQMEVHLCAETARRPRVLCEAALFELLRFTPLEFWLDGLI